MGKYSITLLAWILQWYSCCVLGIMDHNLYDFNSLHPRFGVFD